MNACVVDASVLVSRLLSGDVHHRPTSRWLSAHVAGGGALIVPVLGLIEVSGAVARRTGEPDLAHAAIATLRRIPTLRVVSLDARLGTDALQLAAGRRLRGADAVYVSVAHHLGIPLVTWDREQRERSEAVIDALTPKEAVHRP